MATTQEVMLQYQRAKGDTGSPEVQEIGRAHV